eukprot:331809-Chlamydomonas_euryale.AAC.1
MLTKAPAQLGGDLCMCNPSPSTALLNPPPLATHVATPRHTPTPAEAAELRARSSNAGGRFVLGVWTDRSRCMNRSFQKTPPAHQHIASHQLTTGCTPAGAHHTTNPSAPPQKKRRS